MDIIIKKDAHKDVIRDSILLDDNTIQIPDKIGTYRTNNNVPYTGGLIHVIPQSDVNLFNTLCSNNPDYCIDNNIVIVKVINSQEYYDMLRYQYRKYTGEGSFVKHIDTVILEEKANKAGLVDSNGKPLKIN